MGPIELLFISVGVIIALIGLARGYVKELGNTLIIMSAIFLLTFLQDQITGVLTRVTQGVAGQPTNNDVVMSTFFTLVFILIVFASYSGRTLEFNGTPAPAPGGTLLSLAIGAVNGYLIAGTLWYYQHVFNYPVQALTTDFSPTLTARANAMVPYLPPALFSEPVYWIIPVVLLLILRVRG